MALPPARTSAVARALALVLLAAVFLPHRLRPRRHPRQLGRLEVWPVDLGEQTAAGTRAVLLLQRRRKARRTTAAGWRRSPTTSSWRGAVWKGCRCCTRSWRRPRRGCSCWRYGGPRGSLGTAVGATALMEAACWPFFAAIRTGTPAEVCWAGLLLACSGRVPSRADRIAAPILVGLWANLSPTFGFAFVLLGGLLVGRFLQEVRARRRLTAAARRPGRDAAGADARSVGGRRLLQPIRAGPSTRRLRHRRPGGAAGAAVAEPRSRSTRGRAAW